MKKPNITEGEWQVNRFHRLGQWSCENPDEIHIEESHGVAIATIDPYGTGDDREMGEANAKAISAVPEMMEALMEVFAMYGLDKGNEKAIANNLKGLIETDIIPSLQKAGVEL